jgi:hypothetical protein
MHSLQSGELAFSSVERHIKGDWGEVYEHDRRENELSLIDGFRQTDSPQTSLGGRIGIEATVEEGRVA